MVYKSVLLLGVLLLTERLQVEAIVGVNDSLRSLAQVLQVLGIAGHDAADELEEGVSDLQVVQGFLFFGVCKLTVESEVNSIVESFIRWVDVLRGLYEPLPQHSVLFGWQVRHLRLLHHANWNFYFTRV